MKREKRAITVLAVLVGMVLLLPGLAKAGSLTPTAQPAPTMHTLDEIYNNIVTPLPTGFVLYSANPRFAVWDPNTPSDPNDDMVLDRSTGLIWTRNANLPNDTKTWQDAVTYCANLEFPGNYNQRTDWRLPSIEELTTLTEPYPSTRHPALPIPNPFVNVQSDYYWSSSEIADNPSVARHISMIFGDVTFSSKPYGNYVWPVRGGK